MCSRGDPTAVHPHSDFCWLVLFGTSSQEGFSWAWSKQRTLHMVRIKSLLHADPPIKQCFLSSVTPSHVANRWHIGSHRTPQAVSSLGLRLYNPLHNFIEQDLKKKTHLSFTRKGFLSFALFCFGFTSMSDLDLSSSLRFPLQLMGVSWVHRTRIESNQNQNYLHVCTQILKFQLPSQYFGSANSIYLAVCSTTFCWSPATLCVVSVRLS